MHYCVLMHWGIPLCLHNGTNVYTNEERNDHYVLNVTFPGRKCANLVNLSTTTQITI